MQVHTTQDKVDAYEGVVGPFQHLNKEVKALGIKEPAATLSEGKVRLINRILTDIRKLISDEPESRYLDLLDDETLPAYSDVILILSQYQGALDGFRDRYHRLDLSAGERIWRVK